MVRKFVSALCVFALFCSHGFAQEEDFAEFRNAIFKGKLSPSENVFTDAPACGVLSQEESRVKFRTKPKRANNKFRVSDRSTEAPVRNFKSCLIDFGDAFCTRNVTLADGSVLSYSVSFSSTDRRRTTARYIFTMQEFSEEEGSYVEVCRDVLSGKVKRRSRN